MKRLVMSLSLQLGLALLLTTVACAAEDSTCTGITGSAVDQVKKMEVASTDPSADDSDSSQAPAKSHSGSAGGPSSHSGRPSGGFPGGGMPNGGPPPGQF